MKLSADFRYIARNALRGKWLIAAVTAFLASLIGAQIASSGSGGSLGNDREGSSLPHFFNEEVLVRLQLLLAVLGVIAFISFIVSVVIGGAGKLGYARFNLDLVDRKSVRVTDLFSQFNRLGDGFLMNLLVGIYTFLWSLLFVIPGLIKAYSYAMTPYIMSEHPEYGVNYAITVSRQMMDGNKFRLFCLHFSFIGWNLLCVIPAAIAVTGFLTGNILLAPVIILTIAGKLFLDAYMEAAQAAFYREVSGTERPADTFYI